ncbi:MAG: LPS export ABC transporter periplasmic protein LptC [Alkalispirochaeta sp.]
MPLAASFLVVFLTLFGGGCTFDYEEGSMKASRDKGVPQVEIRDVQMVVVRENRLELIASRVATYPDTNLQEVDDIVFREFGPDGALRLEGRAERGVFYLDTENVELSGEVQITSFVEDGSITSSFLFWNDEARTLSSEPTAEEEDSDSQVAGTVRLERGNGTVVEGVGLHLDGRRNRVEFRDGVQGVYHTDDDAENAAGEDLE